MPSRPRTITVAVLLAGAVSLTACGESSQEKAIKAVCSARTEISKQITKIQGLSLTSTATTELKESFEVIGKELKTIREKQTDLAAARKQQVEPAVQTFENDLKTIAAGVASSLSSNNLEAALKEAGPKIKSATTALAGAYRQTLAPINCS
jgi:beta-phosphoglucomutase-like phosphatase (HAD superfamily)